MASSGGSLEAIATKLSSCDWHDSVIEAVTVVTREKSTPRGVEGAECPPDVYFVFALSNGEHVSFRLNACRQLHIGFAFDIDLEMTVTRSGNTVQMLWNRNDPASTSVAESVDLL